MENGDPKFLYIEKPRNRVFIGKIKKKQRTSFQKALKSAKILIFFLPKNIF